VSEALDLLTIVVREAMGYARAAVVAGDSKRSKPSAAIVPTWFPSERLWRQLEAAGRAGQRDLQRDVVPASLPTIPKSRPCY
jgi:hypothetical protein